MPINARREDAGVGRANGSGSAAAGAARRVEGKRKAKEECAAVGRITKRMARDRDIIMQTTEIATKVAVMTLLTVFESIARPKPSPWKDDKARYECKRAKIEVIDCMFNTYVKYNNWLEDETSKGDEADAFLVNALQKQLKQLEEAMENDSDFQV